MNFTNNQPIIIGIDHGYGNCKTRNCCFRSGVASYDKEPTFKENLLVYNGRYYLVGEEHKEILSDKMADNPWVSKLPAPEKSSTNPHMVSTPWMAEETLSTRHAEKEVDGAVPPSVRKGSPASRFRRAFHPGRRRKTDPAR